MLKKVSLENKNMRNLISASALESSEREAILSQLPKGAELSDIRVGYVKKIELDDAIIHLKGLKRRVFSADYIRSKGLDEGKNRFLALAQYRLNGRKEADLIRISDRLSIYL
jgi:hypothetical protein